MHFHMLACVKLVHNVPACITFHRNSSAQVRELLTVSSHLHILLHLVSPLFNAEDWPRLENIHSSPRLTSVKHSAKILLVCSLTNIHRLTSAQLCMSSHNRIRSLLSRNPVQNVTKSHPQHFEKCCAWTFRETDKLR